MRGRQQPPLDGISETYAPRRHVLDWLLAQAATAAGSELRTRCAVVGLCSDGDRVTGARIRLPGGREVTERAELVIGADGMRSRVARLAGAGEYGAHQRLTCAYYAFWADVPADFEQYQQPGRWIGAMPTHDGLTLVAAYFPQREFVLVRRDPEAAYAEAVRSTAPRLYERMTAGRREGRMLGTGDQRNFLRPAAGPGWALVGDAGHHKDSITARGMTDAFGQAELLARCLTSERGERLEPGRLGAGLRRFAERRDDLVRAGYRSTLAVAQLDVQPERLRMLRAVQGSAELTERYFAAAAGILDPHEVFTPELVELLRSPPGGLAASGGSGGVVWRSAPAALEL